MPVVLHVLEALEGGTARHLVDLVRHVGDVRHEVVIPPRRVGGGVTDEAAAGAIADAGARVHLLDMRRSPARPQNAAALGSLRRLVREVAPDIVHGHSSVGGALARLASWSAPVRRVYTPHGILPRPPALAVERLLGRRTHRLVAVSDSEAELAARLALVPRDRLVVIPNGVDLDPPRQPTPGLRARLGIPPEAPLVGCVARLVPEKATEDFARACGIVARRRPGTHFVLVGTGPEQPAVDREVAAAGLGTRFHQVPVLEGVGTLLGELDVYVLASRREGFPYTPLEAMRCGTAVVLSDAVGNRDVVEDGVSGLLVPAGDVEALASTVVGLLDDPARRAALAEAATIRLHQRFSVKEMAAGLSRLYRQLVDR